MTPIRGLYLSGSDAGCLGIVGAMMGGVGAATNALGPFGFFRIMAAMKGRQVSPTTLSRSPEKRRAVLAAKNRVTPTIWELRWKLDEPVHFAPGQFARLCVADEEWRDYSIASAADGHITLLVSTRTGGKGSHFAEQTAVGTESEIELPLGTYRLLSNGRRRIFVATGTGLAPFLPMLKELRDRGEVARAELLFGCATQVDNPLASFASVLPQATLACLSREMPGPGGFHGRVTAALQGLAFDPATTDFYVCGSAAMVADCRSLLEKAGALYIHTEVY